MTYIGCLIIVAVIWSLTEFIYTFIRHRKIKKEFPNSVAERNSRIDLIFKPFLTILCTIAVWGVTMLFITLICWHIPAETDIRTTINSTDQVVEFKEQRDDKIIVSIQGNEYTCTKLIVSNDINSVQVKLLERKTADNFFAKFFLDELTGHDSFYELYIPACLISSSCD